MDINDKVLIAIITLIVTTLVKPIGAWWKWYSERTATRQALLAEVKALVEIIEIRHYIKDLREAAQSLKADETEQSVSFQVSIASHYRAVYDANLTRLGCLSPEQASKIVSFYQMIDSVVRDVSPGGPLYESTADPSRFNEAAEILGNAVEIANKLCAPKPKCFLLRLGR